MSLNEIFEGLQAGTLSMAEAQKLSAAIVKPAAVSPIRFKVSEKGAVSVYGLGRFPQTLYVGQWERLLAQVDELKAFIEANRSALSVKEAA